MSLGASYNHVPYSPIEISRGLATGKMEVYRQSGLLPTLNIATGQVPIWANPTPGPLNYLAANTAHTIVSTSVNDTLAGTGAQVIQIIGVRIVGADWVQVSELVNMNGTTSVALANTYIRITRTRVVSSGSVGTNAGSITVTGAATTQGFIQGPVGAVPGSGTSQRSQFTIPDITVGGLRVRNAYLLDSTYSIMRDVANTGTKSGEVILYTRFAGTNTWIEGINVAISGAATSVVQVHNEWVTPIPPKSDVVVRARAEVNNSRFSSSNTYLLSSI
jgi:hypothetical protein